MRLATTRSSLTVVAALLCGFSALAQRRPLLPERQCTRVSLALIQRPNERVPGLQITNDDPGDFSANLRSAIEVQQLVDGQWQRVPVAGFHLRASCQVAPRECLTIEPRDSLTVAPWTGLLGDGQCACARCAPAPAGRYRFVLATCAHQDCRAPRFFESAPFELSGRATR